MPRNISVKESKVLARTRSEQPVIDKPITPSAAASGKAFGEMIFKEATPPTLKAPDIDLKR